MKILHLLSSDRLSGAENVVADIIMMNKKRDNIVYCSPEGPIRNALKDRDVNYIPLSKFNVSSFYKALKKFKPDIIHAHDVKATLMATLVGGRTPVVSHLHVNMENMRKINFKSLVYLISSYRVEKIISVSDSVLNEYAFKNQIRNKTTYLKNVLFQPRLDFLIEKDNNEYDFDFVYIGRLTDQKNPKRVAEVAAEVLLNNEKIRFGVVGEGELKKDMQDIFMSTNVSERVTFTGNLPYPYKALKKAKCLLMCSKFEGTPIVALEAMALGVPIVSTPVDGMNNLVSNGETGILEKNNDKLSEAVSKIILDNEYRMKMSQNSKKSFEKHNQVHQYVNALDKIYTNVIKENSVR